MKRLKFFAAVSLIAVFSSPALAGSPDNPGAAGQLLGAAAQTYGAAFGSSVASVSQLPGVEKLGQAIQSYTSPANGGTPNPANDNGGGND